METQELERPKWLDKLRGLVELKALVLIKFEGDEWRQLSGSRHGISEFTIARSHSLLDGIRVPTPCLVLGTERNCYPGGEDHEGPGHLHFGLVASRAAVSTLETRIKVRRSVRIQPRSEADLLLLVTEKSHRKNFEERLLLPQSIVKLSPKLSSYLVDRLASINANHGAMRAVVESLSAPRRFRDAAALQEDALRTALKTFGLTSDDPASSLELVKGRDTALARVNIMEDAVIEHDARNLPGYELVESDLTGRAVFTKDNERLEIFTANKRPLERVFGVDLIYLNTTRQNIAMLQYKMLEADRDDRKVDWIYRPNAKLDSEISRMRKFAVQHAPGPYEYRLNPAVFYLKFVKRDGGN